MVEMKYSTNGSFFIQYQKAFLLMRRQSNCDEKLRERCA
jgi:hypothetical protein